MKPSDQVWRGAVVAFIGLLFVSVLEPARAGVVELEGRKFTLPDGFTIERVAGTPLVDRPIVVDFDEQGRLYVADSSGSSEPVQKQLKEKPHRIVRLEDSDGDGRFDKQTVFADKMMFPEGAMWLDESLYVSAPPSIWKLTDTDGDGVADQRVEWFAGKTLTGCANDLHGPYAGPDGWIYWCKGAFAEQTYPRPDGKPPLVTKASHIFRAKPDGSGIEPVMTGGMDNPVEVAFTPSGERIFTTTFLQSPAGGRRDGLIHAIYGGVYGKANNVLDNHPRTMPDLMPVMVHLGPAAPAGLTRYESEVFGKDYRDNLFAACFNLHKVTRHVLTPAGATFASRDEDFLVCDSLDFHPTDVLEDADGSLLVIDTGGWYKLCCPTSQLGKPDLLGTIYRVRRKDAPRVDDPRGLKLAWEKLGAGELARLLDDARPAVRKRAIGALAAKGDASAAAAAKVIADSKASPLARLGAAWAATRVEGAGARAAVRSALKDSDETVRQAAVHSVSVWRDADALPELMNLLSKDTPAIRRTAAEALGRLGDSRAVPSLLDALTTKDAADPILQHSLTFALIEIGAGPATAAALASDDSRLRRGAMVALDQTKSDALKVEVVARELTSSDPALREAAAWVAGHHPEWGDALAATLRQQMRSTTLSAEDRARLRQQLARLARADSIQALLIERATDAGASADERRLALEAMRDASLREAPQAWLDGVFKVMAGDNPELIASAVTTLRALTVKKEAAAILTTPLLAVAARKELPPPTRLNALAALPGKSIDITPEMVEFAQSRLAPKSPPAERISAAETLGRAKLSPEQLKALVPAVRTAGPMEIDRLLAAFEQSSDDAIGGDLVTSLKRARSLKSLTAESVRKRLAKFGPDVRQQGEELLAQLNPDASKQKARLEELLGSLPSGDIRRGQFLFNSERAACASCHAIGYLGGHVGPDLTRVGAIRQERDLIESVVFPSASFVQSFEPVVVDTTDGDQHGGLIREDTPDGILLLTGPNQEVRIDRKSIKKIRPSTVSVMPEGFDQQFSPQDLADLIAFLKACK